MTTDLSGRTALVTGGNRGIGLAAVRALAEAGAQVTFTARSTAKVDEAGPISTASPRPGWPATPPTAPRSSG